MIKQNPYLFGRGFFLPHWIFVISSMVAVLLDWLAIGSYWGGSLSLHPAVPSSQSTETP